jgi:chromosome partitioning protein
MNMKGGVGKTTVTAHVMRMLYQTCAKRTLLVDLDPQFNLTQAVLTQPAYQLHERDGTTVYAAMEPASKSGLLDIMAAPTEPPDVSTLAHTLHSIVIGDRKLSLDLVPGDFRLVKYSLVDNNVKLDFVKKRFLQFIENARAMYDLVCIDCNPSSSFITLCALHACNFLLIPVREDKYSVIGLQLLSKYVDGIPTLSNRPEVIVLLNGTKSGKFGGGSSLRSDKEFGPHVLTNELRHTGFLEARSTYTGFASDRRGPNSIRFRREMRALATELGDRLGF